jgi:parvulin-like peptidyl-prolyl isomerase
LGVIRRLAVGLLLLPLIMVLGCGGNLPKGAVAKVGLALVSQDQLDTLKVTYEAAGRAPDKGKQPAEYRSFERGLAEYLVVMEVLRQEAPAYKTTITEQDVQGQIDQIKQMFQGDQAKFDAALEKQNLTIEQLTQSMRDRLLLDQLKAAVTKGSTVSEEEAKAYYESHKADFVQQETRDTRHILIAPVQPAAAGAEAAVPTQADWDAAKAEAEKVRSQIQNGADFITEAEKYSDDATTKDSGGDLGPVVRGQMVPAFEEAVFSLKKGELSQPVRTQYGYHLIEVTDITPEEQLAFDAVKENIESTLLEEKRSKTWQEWLAAKQAELGVEYKEGLEPSPAATSIPAAQSTTTSTTGTSTTITTTTTVTTGG